MIPRTMTIREYCERTQSRKSKRKDNARWIARINRAKKPQEIRNGPGALRSLIERGKLKEQIVRLLGLLDRKINGHWCRIHGFHAGEVAYHLVPQQRGDAARFVPENVVWACYAANFGEKNNRSLYRDKHIELFGRERIEAIEAIARTTKKYSMAELFELRASIKAQLEGAA